ncbi:uncharacterized protein ARMOST_21701 [Armillaria ostoyae]|uniref:Uncharacterized protein n=1 Tax=Armillaria ostoyae TaxID=47428 RepID=A0A284SAZ4_ARMOS|nr:uncharacterized protein ARMOST_21701 [Armillaria ostoyae]
MRLTRTHFWVEDPSRGRSFTRTLFSSLAEYSTSWKCVKALIRSVGTNSPRGGFSATQQGRLILDRENL